MKSGVHVKIMTYNRGVKEKIFQNLRDLMRKEPEGVWLYPHELLLSELRHLKWKPTPRGISIGCDVRGDCPYYDFADCLAGAAFQACKGFYSGLPQPILINMGFK